MSVFNGGDNLNKERDQSVKALNLLFVGIPSLMIIGFIIGYVIGSK
jgi:hypothetical protein